jgi:hypothetical protein
VGGYHPPLKMEAACFSETLVSYHSISTQRIMTRIIAVKTSNLTSNLKKFVMVTSDSGSKLASLNPVLYMT